jgi:hypothetical protein
MKESPNSSGTLSSFASGGWYADTAGCILQGDVTSKVKTLRYWENYGRRGCANFYMEKLCKLLYGEAVQTLFQLQGHAWSPTVGDILLFDLKLCPRW